jgi:hypothetical protein
VLGYLGITQQLKRPSPAGKYQVGIFTGGGFTPLPIKLAGGTPTAATIAF